MDVAKFIKVQDSFGIFAKPRLQKKGSSLKISDNLCTNKKRKKEIWTKTGDHSLQIYNKHYLDILCYYIGKKYEEKKYYKNV